MITPSEAIMNELRKLAIRSNLPVLCMVDGALIDPIPDYAGGEYIAYGYTGDGKTFLVTLHFAVSHNTYNFDTSDEGNILAALGFMSMGAAVGSWGYSVHRGEQSRKARLERGETLEPIVYAKA